MKEASFEVIAYHMFIILMTWQYDNVADVLLQLIKRIYKCHFVEQ